MQRAQSPVRDITRLNFKINDNSRKRQRRFLSLTGQSTLEYAVIIAVVAGAIAAMSAYVISSINAHLKTTQDRINASVK